LVARDAAALCVAGVAQSHIHVRFAWQAWHKLTSTIVLRGRRRTDVTGRRAWSWFGRPLTPRHFAWQAWHNLTSTFVLRGRRGTNSHLPSFCVAGVGQSHTPSFTKLCRIPSFTQLCHAPSFPHNSVAHNFVTHNFVTHNSTTTTTTTSQSCKIRLVICIQRCSHTHHLSHTTLSHTTLSHTTPLQPQLQLVSQVRLVICIQRCSHRIIYCCSGRFGPKLFAGLPRCVSDMFSVPSCFFHRLVLTCHFHMPLCHTQLF